MQIPYCKVLLITIIAALISCAPSVYIKTQADPTFDFRNANTAIVYTKTGSIEEKKFKHILQNELSRIGLKIIEGIDDAAISTYFRIYRDDGSYSGNLILPKSTTTTGNVGGINYSEYSSTTQVIPYTEHYSFKKVRIQFYNSKDNSVVWDCFFSIESRHFDEKVYECLRAAMNNYGRDFEGKISLY